ncbi:MAG: hypothetical protein AAFW66_03100 [Pseudomonadota bacterium]
MNTLSQNILEVAVRNGSYEPGSAIEISSCLALQEKELLKRNEDRSFSPTEAGKFAFQGKLNSERDLI